MFSSRDRGGEAVPYADVAARCPLGLEAREHKKQNCWCMVTADALRLDQESVAYLFAFGIRDSRKVWQGETRHAVTRRVSTEDAVKRRFRAVCK